MLKTSPENSDILGRLHDRQTVSHLDYYFAVYMARVFSYEDPLVKATCALVSSALSQGQVCLDLTSMAGQAISMSENEDAGVRLPGIEMWLSALEAAPMVAKSGNGNPCRLPLVLDTDGCLYLSKYFDFQERLVKVLAERIRSRPHPLEPDFVNSQIRQYFTREDIEHTRPQRRAVVTALQSGFTVVSGGPGTGKTYITRIIREILETHAQARHLPSPPVSVAGSHRTGCIPASGWGHHSFGADPQKRPARIHPWKTKSPGGGCGDHR